MWRDERTTTSAADGAVRPHPVRVVIARSVATVRRAYRPPPGQSEDGVDDAVELVDDVEQVAVGVEVDGEDVRPAALARRTPRRAARSTSAALTSAATARVRRIDGQPVVDEEQRAVRRCPARRRTRSRRRSSKRYGVSCSMSNAGRYHGAAPPSFSARTTTLRRRSIISPSVGSGSPGDHTSARRASPPRSSACDRVGGVDVVLEHEHDDLVGVLPQEVVDAAEGVDGLRRPELAVHVAQVDLALASSRGTPRNASTPSVTARSSGLRSASAACPTRCAGRCGRGRRCARRSGGR